VRSRLSPLRRIPTIALSAVIGGLCLSMPAIGATADTVTAVFHDRGGQPIGRAVLAEGPEGVVIRVEIDGLPPGWKAIHVHQTGDCHDHDEGFQRSGAHFDPHDRQHGLLNPKGPEAGDLPNIFAHADGSVRAEIYAPNVRLDASEMGLLRDAGSALVIHEGGDDHLTQPIGGAGARVACAVLHASD
jgi:superoxide dismutase, Cu-Zn family